MVADNAPTPSPTLRAILAPHAEPDPPSNPTRLLTDAERRAACAASGNAPSEPTLSTFAPFRPDAHALEGVLSDLMSASHSLDTIAAKHNTSIPALALWMNRRDVEPILSQMESACYRHVRMAAAHSLPEAVKALTLILNCASEAEASIPIPREPRGILLRERSRTNARKAAWLLYRISRSHPALPIDPATRLKLEEARTERAKLKAELKAQLTAQLKAQHAATPSAQPIITPTAQPAATTHAAPSAVHSFPQSTEQSPPQSIAASNSIPDLEAASHSAPPAPSATPLSPSLPSTPSLRHSITEPLPPTQSLSHSVTDTRSSAALRELRGESPSSSPPEPPDDSYTALESGATEDTKEFQLIHDNHDAALLPCGLSIDSS